MAREVVKASHWWDAAIIYEIYLRSFQDGDGDGVGDLPGLISRLDYLNNGSPDSLGVDAIWLTPIYPSPLYDFGYDVSDYTAIDPIYGTMQDFERLAHEAHTRGIKIVMDLVANHTSHQHPWFRESRSSRGSAKRDWYVWRDPKPSGGPPNNWLSVFGGPAWTLDDQTGQYYLHSFLPQQPDLNWRNPEVREAIFDVVRFWTARGVDGFRLDAIDHIAKDERLRDNPLSPRKLPPGSTGYKSQIPEYSKNDPIIHQWLRELRAAAEEDGTSRLLVGEIYDLHPEEIALFFGAAVPEMSMCFNFDLLACDWNATAVRSAIEAFHRNLPPGAWPNVVLNNHDQPRFISRHDEDGLGEYRARLAALLMLTQRGSVYLYYGEEIGMRNGVVPLDRLRDPVGVRFWPHNPGRDPARTPMQWESGPGAGFTTGEPWLPLGPDYQRLNVAVESRNPHSFLSFYRRLIWQRKTSPALLHGAYRPLEAVPADTYCYLRDAGKERVLVALNFARDKRAVSFERLGSSGAVIASTYANRVGEVPLTGLGLFPLEGLVLRLPPDAPGSSHS